jgi:hypothetical protein
MTNQQVTVQEVEYNVTLAYESSRNRLVKDEEWLHNNGYHAYSKALANMRNKIEKAYMACIEELESE